MTEYITRAKPAVDMLCRDCPERGTVAAWVDTPPANGIVRLSITALKAQALGRDILRLGECPRWGEQCEPVNGTAHECLHPTLDVAVAVAHETVDLIEELNKSKDP